MKTKAAGIATLLALAGIIISELLGLGSVAPQATMLTYIAVALFIAFQYVYLRSRFGWGLAKTAIAQTLSLVPQLLLLFILSFLWFVVLPIIAMVIPSHDTWESKALTPTFDEFTNFDVCYDIPMIDPSEELDVVDANDQVIEALPRNQVHKRMILHRVSLIWTINERGQVLCQKRSLQKDRWAGMWECWFGGHVLSGQTYLDTAVAETKEELGINVTPKQLLLFGKRTTQTSEENLFLSVYALQITLNIDEIEFEKEEIELLQWFKIDNLRDKYAKGDNKWVTYGYELEMFDWLEAKI